MKAQVDEYALGSIAGVVRNDEGLSLSGVRVQLAEGEDEPTSDDVTDAEGRFRFRDLERNDYRLVMDPESLPEGYLPPEDQERCHGYPMAAYAYAPCIHIPEEGGEFEVELTAAPASSVTGRILRPDGTPATGIWIRLWGYEGPVHGISIDVHTDDRGEFSFDPVPPGRYMTRSGVAYDHELGSYCRPTPLYFTVPAFDSVVLPDQRFVRGEKTISGRVVDQKGQPLSNLLVVCYERGESWGNPLLRAGTNNQGQFELAGVPAIDVSVKTGLDGWTGFREVPLLEWFTPVHLDLEHEPDLVELPTFVLYVKNE